MADAPTTGAAVLDLVRKSELVDDEALSTYLTKHPKLPPTAPDTASLLVNAGILTQFQARFILLGRYKGFRLGPYKIKDQIGAGGMGQVYLAEHTSMRRLAAIKVLPAKLAADKAGVQRFYREARAVAALDHPNIVRAYDVGSDQGSHYLVLEYVEGMNLDDRLKEAGGKLSVSEAAGYAVQAASGLQHAHEKGVVHRDIKPANLLIDRDGVLKILDMGLARFFEDPNDNLTQKLDSGAVMGTPDYVAPEQLIGNVPADHRADIYALGASLYHLATGRPPFVGTATSKLVSHQLKTPPLAHTVALGIPEQLSAVINKMMAKDPANRQQNAAEVIADLLPFVTQPAGPASSGKLTFGSGIKRGNGKLTGSLSQTIPIDRSAASAGTDLDASRQKKKLALIGLGATVVIGGVIIAVVLATRGPSDDGKGDQTKNTTPPVRPVVTPPVTPGPTVKPLVTPPTPTPKPQDQVIKPVEPPPVQEITGGLIPLVTLSVGKITTEAAIFTADGKKLITSGGDKLIRIWDADSDTSLQNLTVDTPMIRGLALVPGNRLLSCGKDKKIRLWDLNTGECIKTYEGHTDEVKEIAVLPDGGRFISSSQDGNVWLWNIDDDTKPLKKYSPVQPSPVFALAICHGGKHFLTGSFEGKAPPAVRLCDVETGKEIRKLRVPGSVAHFALSPDGTQVAFGTKTGVGVWDMESEDFRAFDGAGGRVVGVAFTRDGRHILGGSSTDKTVRIWNAQTGFPVGGVTELSDRALAISCHPDGRKVVVVGDKGVAGLWKLPDGVASR